MIKLEALRCFCTVAQTGNLADAAARLGRTQSALSMTLKQLEEHLGGRLFENERKNRLSLLGQNVLPVAQSQVRQFDLSVGSIETLARSPHGLLRIASIPSAAGLALPLAIETLSDIYPELRIELRDMDTEAVIDALVEGQADFGVVSGRPQLTGFRKDLLFEDRFGLLSSVDHPLAKQDAIPNVTDVFGARFVRNALCDLIADPDVQAALPTAKVTVHNTQSLIAMARSGAWVTLLPETVARVSPDDLVFRPVKGLRERRAVSVLVPERSPVSDLAIEFTGILKNGNWNPENQED